jgi:hypothetical protein
VYTPQSNLVRRLSTDGSKNNEFLSFLAFGLNKNKNNLLGLLQHLKANTMVKYSLQIHLYKLIFERNTPFKIKKMDIVWVGGDSLEVFPAQDLETEALAILEDLKE